jgi:hypothetical protein
MKPKAQVKLVNETQLKLCRVFWKVAGFATQVALALFRRVSLYKVWNCRLRIVDMLPSNHLHYLSNL